MAEIGVRYIVRASFLVSLAVDTASTEPLDAITLKTALAENIVDMLTIDRANIVDNIEECIDAAEIAGVLGETDAPIARYLPLDQPPGEEE